MLSPYMCYPNSSFQFLFHWNCKLLLRFDEMAKILSSGLKSSHYDLRIEPDIERDSFSGSVTIQIDVSKPTSSILLNVEDVIILSTSLRDNEGNPIEVLGTILDIKHQTFTSKLAHLIPANSRIFLTHTFSGALNDTVNGFHISPKEPGSTLIASTMMEPRNARKVFPCFDEPSFKATFSVTIIAPSHLTCLGNMPVLSETQISNHKKMVKFEKTPRMPSYLVAFAIGEFSMIETSSFRIPVRAYAPLSHEIEHCRYILDVAVRALEIHEKSFGIDYLLPKLDLIAIPGEKTGIENWGLITMNPEMLVIGPDSPAALKVAGISLIVHELAHQWFGNLVTISSWDHFWLKEALSEWADFTTREQMSDSKPWEEFLSADTTQRALQADSSRFSHALESPKCVDEGNFDVVTYGKGCALIRMAEGWLGKEVFLEGVNLFLRNHVYGNASPRDLWRALSQASKTETVEGVMSSWTKTTGYPVITVEEDEAAGTITLTQNRFLSSGKATEAEDEALYPLFLNIVTADGIINEFLGTRTKTVKAPLDFYKLNANQIGFYRVVYSQSRLQRLGDDICRGLLSVEDRIGLISDTAALAFSGHPNVNISDLLSFLQHFEGDKSFFVWKVIIDTLDEISKCMFFESKKMRNAFNLFCKHLAKRCIHKLESFNDLDDLDEQRFKAMMFGNSGGDETVVNSAMKMYERFVAGNAEAINPNIRAEVFEIVLNRGGKKEVSNKSGFNGMSDL